MAIHNCPSEYNRDYTNYNCQLFRLVSCCSCRPRVTMHSRNQHEACNVRDVGCITYCPYDKGWEALSDWLLYIRPLSAQSALST